MRRILKVALIPLLLAVSARAGEPAKPAGTQAFEDAYAASFYQFDACGDGLTGRDFRMALSARVKQCDFTAEVKQRFVQHAAAQRRKSSQMMAKLIEDNSGLPSRLAGMTLSCHELQQTPEYRAVRTRLDAFAAGKTGPDGAIPQPCDAAEITP